MEKEVKRHESQLSDLEEQQKKILANVRKDTNNLEIQRQIVIRELEKVRRVRMIFMKDMDIKSKFVFYE